MNMAETGVMKEGFYWWIYTKDDQGRKRLMSIHDNQNAAIYTMDALCSHFTEWTFELWYNKGKKSEMQAYRHFDKNKQEGGES